MGDQSDQDRVAEVMAQLVSASIARAELQKEIAANNHGEAP
ncbi:hypothetical protein [Mycobacterium intracellulare]|nr:hypothetical protein [Mycobacterium intracellulare]